MTTQALTIHNISIRQDIEGRFCLNDLHKASGGEDKHRPTYWLKNQQTIDLQKEIEIDGIPSIVKKQGLGTFVVKELVYSYAMWISAKFQLVVIRAYDALVTAHQPPTQPHFVTKEEREPLVKAIRSLVKSYQSKGLELSYADAHRIVNYRLGVDGIDHMTPEQLTQGVAIVGELLQALVLEHTSQKTISKTGFVRPVVESSSNIDEFRLEFSACYKSFLWNFGENVVMVLEKDNDQLVDHARKACSPYHPRKEIEAIRKQLAIWSKMVDDSELLCGAAMDYALTHR